MSPPNKGNIFSGNCSHVVATTRTATLVPTIFEKPVKTMDLDDINSTSKLTALKTRDPFTYYSIPALRRAALRNNEVDVSVLRHDNRSTGRKVTRQTRVSMECHADLLMDDLAAEYDNIDLPTASTASENCSNFAPVRTATLIPTIFEKRMKTIDLSDINSSSKLAALKTRDPFMYHSIPACRKAALHNNEVDESVLRHDNRSIERKAIRQTRVSMECPADVLMEDILAENDNIEFCNETMDIYDDSYENYFSFDKSRSRR
ncbi:hypothetical protein ACHAW6_014560 [Cyclotella cf. meneghiniana]